MSYLVLFHTLGLQRKAGAAPLLALGVSLPSDLLNTQIKVTADFSPFSSAAL